MRSENPAPDLARTLADFGMPKTGNIMLTLELALALTVLSDELTLKLI